MFVSLLDYLPAELLACSRLRALEPDEVLYRRGETATHVYLVELGRLRLFSFDTEGRSVPLYVVRPGEYVSQAALFAEAYCGDVAAEVRSRVRAFSKERLLESLRKNPELSQRYMNEMAVRFNALRVRLELRNLRSARERVLQYLIASAPVGLSSVPLDRPLKSIADDLGLTPESLYRALAQLVSEGVVTRTKRMLTLHQSEERFSSAG